MNGEVFEKLPIEKKKVIEAAYFDALKKEISPSQFFEICRDVLAPELFELLFSKNVSQREQEDIKTKHLQDIMQYSGVNLKEEADHITKETETIVSFGYYSDEDTLNQMHGLLNVQSFRDFSIKICRLRRVSISDESLSLLFQVIKRKLLDFVERMDGASMHRIEHDLSEFLIRIDNDMSRQLWCLEQIEKVGLEKLMIKRDDDLKKKNRKVVQEREDLVIKKKLSNTVALAALGMQQKSWMGAEDVRNSEDNVVFHSIYAPFNEKALEKRISNRVITMKDFVYVLERDKRYNKSIFAIQHYFR